MPWSYRSASGRKPRRQLTSRALMNSRQPQTTISSCESRLRQIEVAEETPSQALMPSNQHLRRKHLDAELMDSSNKSRCALEIERDQICGDCLKIDFSAILHLDAATLQHDRRSGVFIANLGHRLNDALERSCPLCHLFYHMRVLAPHLSDSHEYHLRAYSAINHFNSMRMDGCPERLATKDLPCLAIVSSGSTTAAVPQNEIKFLYCHSASYDRKRIFIPRPISASVDFSRVIEIMRYCKAKHSNLCHDFQPTVPGTKLIDCYQTAKTTSAIRLEAMASRRHPYVALSYVWGNLNDNNSGSNAEDDEPLPKVVLDAMTATKEMGYQYVWIDKYCIDQTNHGERDFQMSHMDVIYRGAEVTIVAASGKDANSGLAGVGDTPRIAQQSLSIGNIQLISNMHVPRVTIESSTWYTRSWTFQEGILPRRRLCSHLTKYVSNVNQCTGVKAGKLTWTSCILTADCSNASILGFLQGDLRPPERLKDLATKD